MGFLALRTEGNYQYIYSNISTVKDLILSAYDDAEDLILTTRNSNGCIRFSTSPTTGYDVERMTILPNGKVGIGQPDPKEALQIGSRLTFNINAFSNYIGFNDYLDDQYSVRRRLTEGTAQCLEFWSGYAQWVIAPSGNENDPISYAEQNGSLSGISMNILELDPNNYKAHIGIGRGPGFARLNVRGLGITSSTNAFEIENGVGFPVFVVRDDGHVGIGTTNPDQRLNVIGNVRIGDNYYNQSLPQGLYYRLSVDGQVVAKEVRVTVEGWSDWVFSDSYRLLSFTELERYIKDNKRLPDMPSSEEIAKEGVNLGEMQAKLLQKIEELTLYNLELKKEIDKLKEKIEQIENK